MASLPPCPTCRGRGKHPWDGGPDMRCTACHGKRTESVDDWWDSLETTVKMRDREWLTELVTTEWIEVKDA